MPSTAFHAGGVAEVQDQRFATAAKGVQVGWDRAGVIAGPIDPYDLAPRSASSVAANGPGPIPASSMTRSPANGPSMVLGRR